MAGQSARASRALAFVGASIVVVGLAFVALSRATTGSPAARPPAQMAVVSARAGALFVAARRQRADADPDVAVYRSVDGGGRWTEVRLPHAAAGVIA